MTDVITSVWLSPATQGGLSPGTDHKNNTAYQTIMSNNKQEQTPTDDNKIVENNNKWQLTIASNNKQLQILRSNITLRVSASKHLKPAINRAKWHLPQIATEHFWSTHQAGSSVILQNIASISSELEVSGLARTASHLMETSFERLGSEGRVSPDALAKGLPHMFFAHWAQRGTEKKTKEMKAKSLSKDEWFRDNGCVWLKIKCELKSLGLLLRALAHVIRNHVKEICGARDCVIAFKSWKPSQTEIGILQRKKNALLVHEKYPALHAQWERKRCANRHSSNMWMEGSQSASSRLPCARWGLSAFMSHIQRNLGPPTSNQCLMDSALT